MMDSKNARIFSDVARINPNASAGYSAVSSLEEMRSDQRKLDAVIRVLGLEDTEDDPAEECAKLLSELERLRDAVTRPQRTGSDS
jgi:hypothetical protein